MKVIHHITNDQLCEMWFANPQWENRAPRWWHLLLDTCKLPDTITIEDYLDTFNLL
jgi:hypothetical protein